MYSYERAVGVSSGISSLVSATDGNHGYGLAHVANLFNTKAKVLTTLREDILFFVFILFIFYLWLLRDRTRCGRVMEKGFFKIKFNIIDKISNFTSHVRIMFIIYT